MLKNVELTAHFRLPPFFPTLLLRSLLLLPPQHNCLSMPFTLYDAVLTLRLRLWQPHALSRTHFPDVLENYNSI